MCYKAYVAVTACFSPDGSVMPQHIIWQDDRVYEIDRVLDVKPACSRKVGGHGMLYRVRIGGKETSLYREEDRWFVEAKDQEGESQCADVTM